MGVEYPFIAVLLSIALFVVALSALSLHVYITAELSRVPVISGVAEAYVGAGNVTLLFTVRSERGEAVELIQLEVHAGGEVPLVVKPPDSSVKNSAGEGLEGAVVKYYGLRNNKTLLPGSTAYIVLTIPAEYLSHGLDKSVDCQVVLLFDKATLVLPFTIQ